MNRKSFLLYGIMFLSAGMFFACGDGGSVEIWEEEYHYSSLYSSSHKSSSSSSDYQKEEYSSSSQNIWDFFSSSDNPFAQSSSSLESSSSENVGEGFVRIGNQIWMDHNIYEEDFQYADYYCYENVSESCEKYGQLFLWLAAVDFTIVDENNDKIEILEPSYGLCPVGTHLPNKDEIEELASYLQAHPAEKSKMTNQLAGYRNVQGEFEDIDQGFILWSSTPEGEVFLDAELQFAYALYYHESSGFAVHPLFRDDAGSIRCLKDYEGMAPKSSSSINSSSSVQSSSSERAPAVLTYADGCDAVTRENWDYLNPGVEYGCIKDARDGRYYKTLIINDRVWLAENLRYVSKKSSWCYTETDDGECDIYGRYYSGYAINETPGICPEGFHVPSVQEMRLLFADYGELELLTVDGWNQNSITVATSNTSGFSLLPGGCRAGNDPDRGWVLGEFDGVRGIARLWTSTQYNGLVGHTEMAFANRDDMIGKVSFPDKENDFGIPVRCIND